MPWDGSRRAPPSSLARKNARSRCPHDSGGAPGNPSDSQQSVRQQGDSKRLRRKRRRRRWVALRGRFRDFADRAAPGRPRRPPSHCSDDAPRGPHDCSRVRARWPGRIAATLSGVTAKKLTLVCSVRAEDQFFHAAKRACPPEREARRWKPRADLAIAVGARTRPNSRRGDARGLRELGQEVLNSIEYRLVPDRRPSESTECRPRRIDAHAMSNEAPVHIVPYDRDWPSRFEAERRRLTDAIGPWLVAGSIEHIGSTAIPGLDAKPVIDIMAGAESLDRSRAALAVLDRYEDLLRPVSN